MTLESDKTLGGVGALLIVICPLLAIYAGVFAGVVGLIGLILVLIALKGLSDHYSEAGILNNALYGIVLTIIGAVISCAVIVIALVDFFLSLGIDIAAAFSDPTIFSSIDWEAFVTLDFFWTDIAIAFAGLVVFFVCVVISAIFLRRSLDLLSKKTGVTLFGTTGLIILIGAIFTIIAVGIIILWIALIVLVAAFFSIRPSTTPPPSAPPQPSQPPSEPT